MTRLWVILAVCGLAAAGGRCWADVKELYRSPLGFVQSMAVNPADGSWWAGDKISVTHFSRDGGVLSRRAGFRGTGGMSVDPSDGSCWVVDCLGERIVRVAADGTEALGVAVAGRGVSVDATDGACWVTAGSEVVLLAKDGTERWRKSYGLIWGRPAADSVRGVAWVNVDKTLVLLSKDGTELWRGGELSDATSLGVDTADGSCWVVPGLYGQLARFSFRGEQMVSVTAPASPSLIGINPADETVWVSEGDAGQAIQFAPDGTELQRVQVEDQFLYCAGPYGVLDPTDGSLLLTRHRYSQVVRLSSTGEELWHVGDYANPASVSVNPSDGSCWVASVGYCSSPYADRRTHVGASVVKVAGSGMELLRFTAISSPAAVAVNPTDGSCWVSDADLGQIIHLSADGAELWRGGDVTSPFSLSANPRDGSCWVADEGVWDPSQAKYTNAVVAHLAADGRELWRTTTFTGACTVAVDPRDGSCWVADSEATPGSGRTLVHLAEDGSEISGSACPGSPWAMAVNPSDGSVWASAYDQEAKIQTVAHIAADGRLLSNSGPFAFVDAVAVDPTDGSCWAGLDAGGLCPVGEAPTMVHLAVDGREVWRGNPFCCPWDMSLNATDGTLWVADAYQLIHLKPSRFSDVSFTYWAYDEIEACAVAGIVKGYAEGTYQPETAVTRDQMAVYIARAIAGGDAAVPTGPASASFWDVPPDYWAFRYIEYAKTEGIVQGYQEGRYRPGLELDRGQMAVFVARARGWVKIHDDMTTAPQLFPDVPAGYWSGTAIKACVDHGVVHGYPDGWYHPGDPCTRDQMAVYVANAFQLPL
jgi:DNA-binding beta-propeller fold protein YncE